MSEELSQEEKNRALAIGQVPVRGGLFSREHAIERMIHDLTEGRLERTPVFVPAGEMSEALAWNFNGEIKFLNDCSKEELLHVCQVLVKKVSSLSPTDAFVQYV